MNNGQNNQPNGAYFTSGIGNLPTNQNQEAIPNLNINESAWNSERNPRDIGNSAISSMETPNADQSLDQKPEMGTIVPLEPIKPSEPIGETALASINATAIRTEGDHITKAALSEVHRAESGLSQTGNASNFYDEVRSMMEANLNNSYNRKLAA